MEENKKSSEKLVGALTDWVETYRNLLGVKVVEHTSMGASISFLSALTMLVIVFILLFLGLGALPAMAAASSGVAAPVRTSIRGRGGWWLPLRLMRCRRVSSRAWPKLGYRPTFLRLFRAIA